MAAEYSANARQRVGINHAVVFSAGPVPCNQGLIFHRPESGSFLLANNAPRSCNCGCNCGCRRIYETVYGVSFHANIAVPDDGDVEEIQLAISVDGDADPSSTMRFTPTAVDEFGNVGAEILVSVPSLCGCESVSVRNISAQDIDVENANIVFTYEGVRRVF